MATGSTQTPAELELAQMIRQVKDLEETIRKLKEDLHNEKRRAEGLRQDLVAVEADAEKIRNNANHMRQTMFRLTAEMAKAAAGMAEPLESEPEF